MTIPNPYTDFYTNITTLCVIIEKIVGRNIRGYRKKINWTQEKLAIRCKLHPQYISRLELGHERPTLRTLVKIAKELKIGVYLLLMSDSYLY